MSDGGENVRRVQEYLQPYSEHLIDRFHISMRATALQQQTKALEQERPQTGAGKRSKRLDLHSQPSGIHSELRELYLYRQGETITTSFVESTINQVVSKRFVKKQQMAWTLRGAHLLLQTRTKVLNNELEDVFRRWFPRFRPKAQTSGPEQEAA